MDEFLQKIAELLEVDPSELKGDVNFKDLPTWDSLAQLSFLALAQDDYGRDLTNESVKASQTIKDLFELVTK